MTEIDSIFKKGSNDRNVQLHAESLLERFKIKGNKLITKKARIVNFNSTLTITLQDNQLDRNLKWVQPWPNGTILVQRSQVRIPLKMTWIWFL